MSKAPPASRTVTASQHCTWTRERESGHTEREGHDHVTCHAGAILPAAKTNVLGVKSDGAVEDDYGNADGRVWLHGGGWLCCYGRDNKQDRYRIRKKAVSGWVKEW